MDNLTHTLFGLTLARTPLGRAGRGVTTALVLASNAPDADIVMTARGNASYLQWHRGPTHGRSASRSRSSCARDSASPIGEVHVLLMTRRRRWGC
jgi:hypothetical protein